MEGLAEMKKQIIAAVLVVVGALCIAGAWAYFPRHSGVTTNANGEQLIATIHYGCDASHSIDAKFYQGPKASTPAPGEPPTPTGRAEVSLDGGTAESLHQTISADGQRYANSDESYVFWAKGNEALVMKNNEMDKTYANCKLSNVLPPG